ncbi:MAG TPA: serine hydrolase domain-containing protein [Allocoleopsis sp.]
MNLAIRNAVDARAKNALRKLFAVLVGLILIGFLWVVPCYAQELPTSPQAPTNVQELEAFLDDFFAKEMAKEHVPGAAVALVKDDKIFFSKGYGYADLEKKIPVVPDKTLFRVGSISKLFTTTAVLQLAEQGKLKLDDDVNKYLKRFQVKNTYPKPVTIANLLTHTDGFDSGWGIGAFARRASEMTPLGDFLTKRLPPLILPPGEVFLYSDVGMNLAGYLVEEISGAPFAQYIEQNILQPLDMRRSSFVQTLPPELASDLAGGYKYKNGIYSRRPFAFSNTFAGNGMMATVTDIAHFAIAQLQNGRYGTARILNEATVKEMQRRQFTHDPRMIGAGYGFYEDSIDNQLIILHNGRQNGYTSKLALLPEQNLGLIVTCNNNPTSLNDKLVKAFLEHYYPAQEKPIPPSQGHPTSQEFIQKLGGTYRYNRYPHHTLEKLAAVFGEAPEVPVLVGKDGTVSIYVPENKAVEVEPLFFRTLYSDTSMTFRQDERGRTTYMFLGDSAFGALEKLAWYETKDFQLKLVVFCTLVFFSTCVVRSIGWLIRRTCKPSVKTLKMPRLAQFLAVLVSALNLIFLIGLGLVLLKTDFWELFFGLPPAAIVLLLIPPLTTGLTLGLLVFTVLAWKNQYWSAMKRVHYSFITLAALGFVSFLSYWNLLGFQL